MEGLYMKWERRGMLRKMRGKESVTKTDSRGLNLELLLDISQTHKNQCMKWNRRRLAQQL